MDQQVKIVSRPTFDRSKVLKVYSGRDGCMCGCLGKYRYRKATASLGAVESGYPVAPDEVNEGMVTRILSEMSQCDLVEMMDDSNGGTIYSYLNPENGRLIAVYCMQEGK